MSGLKEEKQKKPCIQERAISWVRWNIYSVSVTFILAFCSFIYFFHPDSLTVNLFSSAIFLWMTVIVIEKILERTRLQRNQKSISYANRKIMHVCIDLIKDMEPPIDLENKRLAKDKLDTYVKWVDTTRRFAIERLERITDTFFHLIKPELLNEVLKLIESFDAFWTPELLSYFHEIPIEIVISDVTAVMSQSLNIVKKYNLLTYGQIRREKWRRERPYELEIELTSTSTETQKAILLELENIVKKVIKISYGDVS